VDASSGALALEDEELMAKGDDLSLECSSRPKKRAEHTEKGREGRGHHRKQVGLSCRKHQRFRCRRGSRKAQHLGTAGHPLHKMR